MGGVVHFEIPADDQERARNFYNQALGWRIDPMPEMDYNVVITTPMDEQTGQPTEPGAINGGMMASGIATITRSGRPAATSAALSALDGPTEAEQALGRRGT